MGDNMGEVPGTDTDEVLFVMRGDEDNTVSVSSEVIDECLKECYIGKDVKVDQGASLPCAVSGHCLKR